MSEQRFNYQAYFDNVFKAADRMREIFEENGAHSPMYSYLDERLPKAESDDKIPERIATIRKLEAKFYEENPFHKLQSRTNFQIATNGAVGVIIYDDWLGSKETVAHLLQTPLGNVELDFVERSRNYPRESSRAMSKIGLSEFNFAQLCRNRAVTYACITQFPWNPAKTEQEELPSPIEPGEEGHSGEILPKEEAEAIFAKVLDNYKKGIHTPVYRGEVPFVIDEARLAREKAAREQAERDRQAREKAEREQTERERQAREKAQREQAERERQAREKATKEQAEKERQAREEKASAKKQEPVEKTPEPPSIAKQLNRPITTVGATVAAVSQPNNVREKMLIPPAESISIEKSAQQIQREENAELVVKLQSGEKLSEEKMQQLAIAHKKIPMISEKDARKRLGQYASVTNDDGSLIPERISKVFMYNIGVTDAQKKQIKAKLNLPQVVIEVKR